MKIYNMRMTLVSEQLRNCRNSNPTSFGALEDMEFMWLVQERSNEIERHRYLTLSTTSNTLLRIESKLFSKLHFWLQEFSCC